MWATILLAGCGGSGGGTLTDDLVCRGSGVIVGGKVTFIKRLHDDRGLTGARVILPVRYALVELVLQIDGRPVGRAYTDENGNYCVQANGVPPGFPTVYPRVATRTDPDRFKIAVVNSINSSPPSLYSRLGTSLNGTVPGIYRRDIPIPVLADLGSGVFFSLSGAFNIMDVATRGAEHAIEMAGRPPSAELLIGWTPGTVFGSGTLGTYFVGDDPTQRLAGIELSGGAGGSDPDSGDHDEFDDDVILHEYGHFVAYSFSKPAEAGGAHYLNDSTQDIRLAWSEGWATFLSAAVRNSPVMVNTRGGDPGHPEHDFSYAFDIERPHSDVLSNLRPIPTPLEEHGVYTTSEVSVASVLWDLYDARNETGDRYTLGLRGVWDVFARLVSAPSNVSLETFADFFASTGYGMPNLAQTAELRRVQFFSDVYEPEGDDSIAADPPLASSGVVTCHTLFPKGDVDYVQIVLNAPSAVTVETYNLSNGADTFIQLLDSNGTLLEANDNVPLPLPPNVFRPTGCGNRVVPIPDGYYDIGINNGTRLASKLSTVLPAGTYYAGVSSSSNRNPGAGELGSYDLMVTVQ